MHGAAVEVRKNPKSTTWYNAVLLDINGENIRVGFEDDIWPSREVPACSVRRCPEEHSGDDFDPNVDEVVEVMVSASESNPSGWALGRVKTIKNSFYFIGFAGTQKGKQDLIVERNALRRANSESLVDLSTMVRRCIPVDPELHLWINSQDSLGCLSHVQNKGRLLVANCTHVEPGAKRDPEVLLIGGEREVDLGEKLLQLHFKNQIEMQRFHEQREQLMERLAERRQWYSAQHQEVFTVEQNLVGRLIGKKGENIRDIRDRHGVEIHIEETESWEKRPATVTVTGETAESVKAAREDLEFVSVRIDVDKDQVGWILGKGYSTIMEIARKTDLHHARYDDKTSSLELCGLRHQVEDAKLLISVHKEYLSVYQDMDEEQHAIQQSFEQLEGAEWKGKGGGKSKSKDKDWGSKGAEGGYKGNRKGDEWGKGGSSSSSAGADGKGSGRGKGKDGKDGKGEGGQRPPMHQQANGGGGKSRGAEWLEESSWEAGNAEKGGKSGKGESKGYPKGDSKGESKGSKGSKK
mmetsp:Transcript_71488/g.128687  ORF Transcript_71488/g.128687 Transcript_71488/m.128687 type:complete len:522 (-) Transcript_71488:63-1628(-)